jgi:hypothetical protein
MRKILLLLSMITFIGIEMSTAQLKLPAPSPGAKSTYTFGVTDVTIDYSRPSLKGRKFGEGDLNHYGKFWRTGANSGTAISFSTEVTIGGTKVPAGKYGLYTWPGQNEWVVIISKNSTVTSPDDYKKEEDVARVTVKPVDQPNMETFTIDLQNVKPNSADLEIKWGTFKIPVTIEADANSLALANIDKQLGSTWNTYASAANFTLSSNTNIEKGRDWINKSVALNEHYWNLHMLAKFQALEGKYNDAVKTLERSNELATKEGANGFTTFVLGENKKLMDDYKMKVTVDTKKKK